MKCVRFCCLTLGIFLAVAASVAAQQYVVFKVKTPFMSGEAVPDSSKVNDYYVKIGTSEGVQIGSIMNVYREKEIEAEFGNFKVKTKMFIGRVKAVDVQADYSISRVVELAKIADPHLERRAVMAGDFVQPVFVVKAERLFDSGSSVLRTEARLELDRAAAFIQRFKPTKVRIEGHTDNAGEEAINLTISEDRAVSVKNYLVSQKSFDQNLFITVGYGESKPIAPNDTAANRAKNRRFEIVIER